MSAAEFATSNPIDALTSALNPSAPTESSKHLAIRDGLHHVTIANFDGPLDLLLHLIRVEQINIYDIPIADICARYRDHLDLMKTLDINIAAEFIVMAATLTHIKSIMLLPKEEIENEDDPRTPLVAQLLEYEKFKKASQQIEARPWLYRELFPRSPSASDRVPMPSEDAAIEPVETFHLLLCLKAALDRTYRPPLEITTDTSSVKDRIEILTKNFEQKPVVDFASTLADRSELRGIIASFLVILELAKLGFIEIIQHENFSPIYVKALRPLAELNFAMLETY